MTCDNVCVNVCMCARDVDTVMTDCENEHDDDDDDDAAADDDYYYCYICLL